MKHLPSLACPGQQRRFVLFGAIYVLLWIATWYSAKLLDSPGEVSLWFLPAGLRFFCLLVFGWPGVLLELTIQSVFALMQVTSVAGAPITDFLSTNTLWRLFNLLGSLAANALVILPLRRWMRDGGDFALPAHSAVFFVAALAVSALSALAGTFGIVQLGFIKPAQFPDVFPSWMLGDFIGIITLAPLLLVRTWPSLNHYLQHGRWRRRHQSRPAGDDLRTVLIAVPALLLIFGIPWHLGLNAHFPLIALLLLLPLSAVALRYGLRGAVLAVALLDSGLVMLIGLFGQHGQALQYQVVMIAIAFVGLWFGGVVDARRRLMVRYRDFASVSNDLLWETDGQGRLTEASGRLAKHVEFALGQSWRSLLDQQAQPQLTILEQALAQRQPFRHLEICVPGAADDPVWLQLNGLPRRDESGVFVGYRGTAVDVTRARQADALLHDYNRTLVEQVAERTRELETKERHLEVLLAAVPIGVLEIDDKQRCRYINVNGCALTGYTQEQAHGRHFLDFVHPDERDYVGFVWKINHQSSDVHWLEFRLDRTRQRCAAHWIRLSSSDQSADGAVMVLTNATARSQHDEKLWTLAHHDALTDLPNRNLFGDRAKQALLHAKRHDGGAALLWIDLDGFKAVNDRLGHAAGDALLQQVAQRLRARIRSSDTVARMGGDEFAVIMPDVTAADDGLQAAGELLAGLAEPFDLPQGPVNISGSIGVALYPQHAQSADTLTQCADMAMYAAKNSGRNQVRLWSDG